MNTRKSPKRTSDGVLKSTQTVNKWNTNTNLAQKLRHQQQPSIIQNSKVDVAPLGSRVSSGQSHPKSNRSWRNTQQGRNYSSHNYSHGSSLSSQNGNISSTSNQSYKRQKSPHNHVLDSNTARKDDELSNNVLTLSLNAILSEHGLFEDEKTTRKRNMILQDLEILLNDWSRTIRNHQVDRDPPLLQNSKSESFDETCDGTATAFNSSCAPLEQAPGIRLITFGSFRLGVHSPTADLDVLALCPPFINKEIFFRDLVHALRRNNRITQIHAIPAAFTPVIKFYMDGLPIDMLYANVRDGSKLLHITGCDEMMKSGRDEFTIDDSLLSGLDEQSVRSLNGVRVVQYLLRFIPQMETYRIVLKTVKRWACVNGLYSNVLGFLGGINFAILVAWVCKRNPDASSPALLLKIFFRTFSRWDWPNPVILTQSIKVPAPAGVSPFANWDPIMNARDALHIMPIITPCYPTMNSTYNVGKPQLRRLVEEMQRSDRILNAISKERATWSDLLKTSDFFSSHIHFLQVTIIANSAEDHRAWFGFCESRLRILIAGIDSYDFGIHAYPFAQFFTEKESLKSESTQITSYFYIALRFDAGKETVDTPRGYEEFLYIVNTWDQKKAGMDLKIDHILQHNLPPFVFSNQESASNHDDNNPEDMAISTPLKKTKTNQAQ